MAESGHETFELPAHDEDRSFLVTADGHAIAHIEPAQWAELDLQMRGIVVRLDCLAEALVVLLRRTREDDPGDF